jgi:hypothetical protein
LHGDQRIPTAGIHRDRIADIGNVLTNPHEVFGDIPGIDDKHVMPVSQPVDQHIINDRALFGYECRILSASNRELRSIIRAYMLDGSKRIVSGYLNLSHVTGVKESGGFSDSKMLLRQAGIFHRHFPARKVHKARTKRTVA